MSFVVGLTGGIGSGKSAAAAEFGRLGAAVVDTDAIAHELTEAGGGAIPEIRRVFGPAAIEASGAMDRGKMRARVFADPLAKKALEALLHPLIREESQRRIAAARAPYVIHVVPLLVASPHYCRRVDRALGVDAPEARPGARALRDPRGAAPRRVARLSPPRRPRAGDRRPRGAAGRARAQPQRAVGSRGARHRRCAGDTRSAPRRKYLEYSQAAQ